MTWRQAFKWDLTYKRASNKQVTLGLQRSLKGDTAYLNPIRPALQVVKGILYIRKLTNGSNTVFPKVSNNASSFRNMKKEAQDLKISSVKLANYVMLKTCYKCGPRLAFGSNAGCSNEEKMKPFMQKFFPATQHQCKTCFDFVYVKKDTELRGYSSN